MGNPEYCISTEVWRQEPLADEEDKLISLSFLLLYSKVGLKGLVIVNDGN